MSSAITTSVSVDPPLVQNASYRFNPADRQYIDDQIRGCEQHLVDSVLSGMLCTWVDLDSASAAVVAGDLGCSACDPLSARKMTKVTAGALGSAKSVFCVFLSACAPGGRTRAAIGGRIPNSITGLAASGGFAIAVPATGRIVKVGSFSPGDYPVGAIDIVGSLTFRSDLVVTGGGLGGESHTLYVDTGGNDATAQKGNQAAPYEHIQTALNAMVSGDKVKAGPGTFAETLRLPNLAAGTLEGSDMLGTIVTSADATATIGAAPVGLATALQNWTISKMTFANSGAGAAFGLSGASLTTPGLFVGGALVLDRVFVAPGDTATIVCADKVFAWNCLFGALNLSEVDSATIESCQVFGTASPGWDHTATLPVGVGGSHRNTFIGCKVNAFNPRNVIQAEFRGGVSSTTTADFTENGATEGTLRADGDMGAVTIVADSVAAVSSADLRGATMSSLTVTSGAGASRVAVDARGSVVSGTVTSNNLCDVDVRGGTYGALASSGSGTIERSHERGAIELENGDRTITFTVPFTTANYHVSYELTVAASPITPWADKLATAFKATSTAHDTAAWYDLSHD